ncbi:putative G-protein coupled receptor 135 [Trichoplax sp. H2]|nr:putative G-protein coupled receptor 135 [Trichoplax sp. H2]|eukprot:RDD36415.1 putative G-protein coupled receptor 135 [Trichoplax sp. H2]
MNFVSHMSSFSSPFSTPSYNSTINPGVNHCGYPDHHCFNPEQNSETLHFNSYSAIISWITIGIYIWSLISNSMIAATILARKQLHSLSFYQILNISLTGIVFNLSALSTEFINYLVLSVHRTTFTPFSILPGNLTQQTFLNTSYAVLHSNTIFSANNEDHIKYSSFPVCQMLIGIIFTSINAGTFILVAIGIHHYFAVYRSVRQNISTKRYILITVAIWLFATGFCIPYAWLTIKTYYNTSTSRICAFTSSNRSQLILAYTIVFIAITSLFPYIVMCVCYSIVIYKLYYGVQIRLRKPNFFWNVSNSEHDYQYDRKVKAGIRLIIIITLLYMLCLSPYSVGLVLAAATHFHPTSSFTSRNGNITAFIPFDNTESENASVIYGTNIGILFGIAIVCLSVLFAFTPVAYLICNQRLQKEFIHGLLCRSYIQQRRNKVTVFSIRSRQNPKVGP